MPNSSQQNAYSAAQSTGVGVLKDALGNVIAVGAQMPAGAAAGNVLTSDAAGNITNAPNAAVTSVLTTLGDTLYENATPAPARLAGNTSTQVEFLSQTGNGSASAAPAWSVVSGQYLAAPYQYAPSGSTVLSTTSATLAAPVPAATTVAAGSNGGLISGVAAWANPSPGVLSVATTTGWPAAGTITVAASGATTAIVTYTGTAAGQLTGCAYVSGSPSGTVSTGGAVTLTSSAMYTGPFTAPPSGSVIVTASFTCNGTGTDVVAFALTAHGTLTPVVGNVVLTEQSSVNNDPFMTIPFLVTGLTPGTSYNFDLLFAISAGGTLNIRALGQSSVTPTGASSAPVAPALVTVQAV